MIIAPPPQVIKQQNHKNFVIFAEKTDTLWRISTINIRHANIRYVRFVSLLLTVHWV